MKAKKIRNLPTTGIKPKQPDSGVCTLNYCAWFKWLVGGHTCAKVQRWIKCGLFRKRGDICSWNAECVKGRWWVTKLENSADIRLQRALYIMFKILDSLLRSMKNHLKGWKPSSFRVRFMFWNVHSICCGTDRLEGVLLNCYLLPLFISGFFLPFIFHF